MDARIYEALARLLEYPGPETAAVARSLGARPRAAAFAAAAERMAPHELEELYVRTFDLKAPVCLDLGYQIFGETYQRGAFLVTLKQAARRHGLDGGVELPDHLSVVLRLLPRLGPDEDAAGLVRDAVLPALAKMRQALGGGGDGYAPLLALVEETLRDDFAAALGEAPADGLPFHLPVVAETRFFEGVNERD